MKAWNGGTPACHHELALEYTRTYPLDNAGWIALAEVLIMLAKYDDAVAALGRARRLSRKSVRHQLMIWSTLGWLYRERGDLSQAIRCYRRAVALGPHTSTLVLLGAVFAKKGDFAEAKRCHRRAIRLATETPDEAHLNLGLVLRAERRYEEALACFDRALELDPEDPVAAKARRDCVQALAVIRDRAR